MKKILLLVSISTLSLILMGCATATPYQSGEGAFAGGFYDKKINYHEYAVSFNANGFSDQARARELALLRVAELCLRDGYNYFVVYREQNKVDRSQTVTMSNYVPLPYGGGMMMSNTTPTAKPYSQVSAMGFVNKPVSLLEVYNAQEYWDNISIKYNVKTIPVVNQYVSSKDAENFAVSLIEKTMPKSLKKFATPSENIIIKRNSTRSPYGELIFWFGLSENPFLSDEDENKFLKIIAEKYGANYIGILDYATQLRINDHNPEWKKKDNENNQIKFNYGVQVARLYPSAIGIKYRLKPFQEEGRKIIRLLESENAKKSGLLLGDEILLFDGIESKEYSIQHFDTKPGDKLKLTIARNGKQMDIVVKLSHTPETP